MIEHVRINGLDFADKSLKIHGRIAASQLDRLADSLSPEGGELDYELRGGRDEQGRQELVLQLQGWLGLTCQRCLGPLRFEFDARVRYELVQSEQDMPAPEDERDDVDYLVVDGPVDVTELIADELLLGLPLAPLHEPGRCTGDALSEQGQKDSPFKVLQGLKKSKE